MSYSFYWDCALPISNIRDIVNINIVPSTNAVNEGDYISVRGYVAIDGEYISLTGVQYLFSERLPLDITLPSDGCVGEIRTDVSNFDYTIQSSNQLHLNLNLTIHGYEVRMDDVVVPSEVEAVEYNQSFESNLEEIDLGLEEDVLDPDRKDKQPIKKPVVTQVEDIVVQTQVEDVVEVKEEVVIKEVAKEPVVTEVVTEVVVEEMKVTPAVEKIEVTPMVEKVEVTPMIETVQVTPSVENVNVTPTIENVEVGPVTVENVNIETVFPFVVKSEPKETVEVKEKSKIFDMLYELDAEPTVTVEEVVEVKEEVVVEDQETVVKTEVDVVEEVKDETVYGHFSDGESMMKIVFIQEEVVTVEQICDKYDVPLNCVEGLNGSNTVFHCNDRVMIRYDRN